MRKYPVIKREFSFLESEYGFREYMKQERGSYYFSSFTNGKKDIMILYDDAAHSQVENPVWIRVFDADSLGTYADGEEFRSEFFIPSGSPQERIHCAALWLRKAIKNKTVSIE